MEKILMIVPFLGVIALAFAAMLTAKVNKQEPGTDRMKEIAAAISEGAQAFLTAEYKILLIFVVVLFILIGVGIGNWITAICISSILCCLYLVIYFLRQNLTEIITIA